MTHTPTIREALEAFMDWQAPERHNLPLIVDPLGNRWTDVRHCPYCTTGKYGSNHVRRCPLVAARKALAADQLPYGPHITRWTPLEGKPIRLTEEHSLKAIMDATGYSAFWVYNIARQDGFRAPILPPRLPAERTPRPRLPRHRTPRL